MVILVTGGAGFIGSHFIDHALDKTQAQLVCLDNFNDYYDPALKRANLARWRDQPRVTVVEADFCDSPAMAGLLAEYQVTHIVHLGAYAGVRPSIARPLVYERANVQGTLALLEAARQHPVKRFVSASSSTVYGQGAPIPFVEDAPLGVPLSPYGATKLAAEVLAKTYFVLHGVPIVNVRLFSVYGPRLRPDLALSIFTAAIVRGTRLPLFGDGSIRRDFTHVRDICDGLWAALQRPGAVGESINLGHNQPIEVREMIALIEAAAGRKAVVDRLPPAQGDLEATWADLTKAKLMLDYAPKVPFTEGVAEFVEWWQDTHRGE